jgi:hypothetical protein
MQRSGYVMAHDPLGCTRLGRREVGTMPPPGGGPQERPARAWRGLPWRLLGAWLAALTLGLAVGPRAQAAAPCRVPSSTYPTIQAAVNDTTCATINVAAGTYDEHVTIGRDVTIRGDGQESTIIDGGGHGSVVTITRGTVTITGVTIQHGAAELFPDEGGGIRNFGALTVQNSTLAANTAEFGGGGLFNASTLTIQNSTVTGNTAFDDGGGLFNEGTVTLTRVTFENNTPNDCSGCP